MRAELVTTPLARMSGKENDALRIECEAREIEYFTNEDTEFNVGGKRYYFKNNQSFGNKEEGAATIWLFAD